MQRQSTNLKRKKEKERYGTTQAAHYITPPRTMAAFFLHSSTSPEWSRRPPSKKKKKNEMWEKESEARATLQRHTHAQTPIYWCAHSCSGTTEASTRERRMQSQNEKRGGAFVPLHRIPYSSLLHSNGGIRETASNTNQAPHYILYRCPLSCQADCSHGKRETACPHADMKSPLLSPYGQLFADTLTSSSN